MGIHRAIDVGRNVLDDAPIFQDGSLNVVRCHPYPKSKQHDHHGNNIFQATVNRDDGKFESIQSMFTPTVSLGYGDS